MRIVNLKDFNGIYFSPSSSIGIKVVDGAEKVSVEDDLMWEYPTLSDGKYHSTRYTSGYILEQGKEYTCTRYEYFWLPRNNELVEMDAGYINSMSDLSTLLILTDSKTASEFVDEFLKVYKKDEE